MNKTPSSNRTTVGIFGNTNSGKSSLFNGITNTDISIVSDINGTTTDPVIKLMELIPAGPITLIDTAGLNDTTILGNERVKKTLKSLNRIDYGIYVIDLSTYSEKETKDFEDFKKRFDEKKIPYTLVFNKVDLLESDLLEKTKKDFLNAYFITCKSSKEIDEFKKYLADELVKNQNIEKSLLKDLLPKNSNVILVAPQDSEAPKGRLILPQAQIIRDCLDNDILCSVCTVETLQQTINNSKKIDLCITDSQAFKEVETILDDNIPLTSFSILFARQKGDINILVQGVEQINNLKDGDKILMAEVCTHNISHEDIGRVKIPNALKKKTGKNLEFVYSTGRDYPNDLADYSLVVHCGGCMITPKEMNNRISLSIENGVPITNYGTLLAFCNGILEKSIAIIK